jgi:hypothetical protein
MGLATVGVQPLAMLVRQAAFHQDWVAGKK